jgi:acyl-CoA reductase-like NAD-dependent aldehyde dehydrogenase
MCFSTERIIVHKAVYDEFTKILSGVMSNLPNTGDAVTQQSAKHAYDILIDAQEKGAQFLVGGP